MGGARVQNLGHLEMCYLHSVFLFFFKVNILTNTHRNIFLFLSHLLIAGCDIGVQISVRPYVHSFVRSFVRSSVNIYVEVWFSRHQ